jgi:hypothetical protein
MMQGPKKALKELRLSSSDPWTHTYVATIVVSTHIQACEAIIEEFLDQEFCIEEDTWDLLIVGLPNMSKICHWLQTF